MVEDDYVPANAGHAKDMVIVLTGCSGSGKSTLLAALAARGYRVVAEPGRQVIKEQVYIGGDATPNGDAVKFLELTIFRTIHHMISMASAQSPIFFDRSIVDQVAGFALLNMEAPAHLKRAVELFRYHRRVFVTPPWKEIFRNDTERRQSFEEAVALNAVQLKTYQQLGYELVVVPRTNVEERADFVLQKLSLA